MAYDPGYSPKQRKRSNSVTVSSQSRNTAAGVDPQGRTYTTKLNLRQLTVSEGHPWKGSLPQDGQDLGGPFYTEKTEVVGGNFRRNFSRTDPNVLKKVWSGQVLPAGAAQRINSWSAASSPSPEPEVSSDMQLAAFGTTAISRCKPTGRPMAAFASMRELRNDGLPSIPGVSRERVQQVLHGYRDKRLSGAFKGPASEYLNIVFGWSPLIADVKNLHTAVTSFDKLMAQYERDSGRIVRRKYRFPKEPAKVETTTLSSGVLPFDNADTYSYLWPDWKQGKVLQTRSVEQSRWFSGAFMYHLDSGNDSWGQARRIAQKADASFGALPTPETIYESSPWTWLVDWFSNTGDVVSNISDMLVHGLVMPYGYMMETTTIKYSWTGSLPGMNSTLEVQRTFKKRIRATPFGFGLTDSSLTAKQKAILAALGIVRVAK